MAAKISERESELRAAIMRRSLQKERSQLQKQSEEYAVLLKKEHAA